MRNKEIPITRFLRVSRHAWVQVMLAARLAWIWGLALLCLTASAGLAERSSFRDYTEGLKDFNINCIGQDQNGYLWVGTENGLFRYDGVSFRAYGAAEGMNAHYIMKIYSAPDGTLWVGTSQGIYFQRRDGSFAEVAPPAPESHFSQRHGTSFATIAPGEVVVATMSGAFLLRRGDSGGRQGGHWTAEPMHLEGNAIRSVLAGPGGVLWYGCDLDLCRLADGKTTHMGRTLGLPDEKWSEVLLAHDGRIWVRGLSHMGALLPGIMRFESHDLPGGAKTELYASLCEDLQGRIVASQGTDFGLWDGVRWRIVATGGGPTHFNIGAMFVDRDGSVWMGVLAHGLKRWLETSNWEAYTDAGGLSSDIVWATLRDRKGRLWIGTESGLDWIPTGGTTPRPWPAGGIQDKRIYSLAEGEDGSIWVGISGGNLVRIDPETRTSREWKTPEVYQLLMDRDHRLWVATGEGLYVVDMQAKGATPRLIEDPAISNARGHFSSLTLDAENHLWTASDSGLYRMSESGWRHMDGLPSGLSVDQIAADPQGNLWAGGTFQGLVRVRFKGDTLVETARITTPSLLSDQVVSLFVDHRGWLWVGQDAGLSVFDGKSWRGFTQQDGLIWNDTNSDALAEDNDGSIWIGTTGGLAHLVNPQAIPQGPPSAPNFSEVTFGSVPVVDGAQILWSASPLAISIGSLSFRDDRHFRIRYRLLGLETDWSETAEKALRYPRLEPGGYHLQAEAVDASSGALSPIQEFSFRIKPLWWQSWWLKLGLALLMFLVAGLVWHWRVRVLVMQKRHLELAVKQRTEDLEREKTELFRTREQMRHEAEHDGLTELWNRRVILERLRQEVDRARRDNSPMSVMLVDLDHFKRINDTLGHPAGDQVLKAIAALFQSSVRSYDWIGRYGGEEFLLVLPGCGPEFAQIRAEEFRMALHSAPIYYGETEIRVTASFGVAAGLPSDPESMILIADAALYRAKNSGRDCVIITEVNTVESTREKR